MTDTMKQAATTGADLLKEALQLGLDHARWSRDRAKDPTEQRLNERDMRKIESAIRSLVEGQPAAAAPKAWMTEDGERVLTAQQIATMREGGGASASAAKPYTVPLVPAAAAGADAMREAHELLGKVYALMQRGEITHTPRQHGGIWVLPDRIGAWLEASDASHAAADLVAPRGPKCPGCGVPTSADNTSPERGTVPFTFNDTLTRCKACNAVWNASGELVAARGQGEAPPAFLSQALNEGDGSYKP